MDQFIDIYQVSPKSIAEFKKNEMLPVDFNIRMLLLGNLTLGIAILSKKVIPSSRYLRNGVFSYFLFGTFIVPELFNPFNM